MKKFALGFWGAVSTMLLWSQGATAASPGSPFLTCADAENYSYNVSGYLVASAYAKVACNPALVNQYDVMLKLVVPPYIGSLAGLDPDSARCIFKGAYDGWVFDLNEEYKRCPTFGSFSRFGMGYVAAALLKELVNAQGTAVTPAVVSSVFAYDKATLQVADDSDVCANVIRADLRGTLVSRELTDVLVTTVCL
jgi:hypothetical protein